MYFITKKSSETGKKFQSINKRATICVNAAHAILDRLGATEYCPKRWSAWGGIEIVVFENEPDMKIWKKHNDVINGYTPRMSSKEGKAIREEFDSLPTVDWDELNACIGFDGDFKKIGFDPNNDEYFAFTIKEDWDVKIPSDCEEITTSKYKELFSNKA